MCLTLCLIYGKTIHSRDLPSPPWPPKPLELSQHFVTDPRTACLSYNSSVLNVSDSVLLHMPLNAHELSIKNNSSFFFFLLPITLSHPSRRCLTNNVNAGWGKCHHTNKSMPARKKSEKAALSFTLFRLGSKDFSLFIKLYSCVTDRWWLKKT